MHFDGLIIGTATFLIIGAFHPIVVKAEYHFGAGVWPGFLAAGLGAVGGSLFVASPAVSGVLAVFGFSCLWSIKELFEQVKRVEKGWAKRNPRRRRGGPDDGRQPRSGRLPRKSGG